MYLMEGCLFVFGWVRRPCAPNLSKENEKTTLDKVYLRRALASEFGTFREARTSDIKGKLKRRTFKGSSNVGHLREVRTSDNRGSSNVGHLGEAQT